MIRLLSFLSCLLLATAAVATNYGIFGGIYQTGTIIYATSTIPPNGQGTVTRMLSNGTAITSLTSCGATTQCWAHYNVAGTQITFQHQGANGAQVYVANPDGSSPTNISPTPGFDIRPSFDPTGNFIVFNRVTSGGTSGETDISIMSNTGTGYTEILAPTANVFNLEPRWSSNNVIVFFSNRACIPLGTCATTGAGLQDLWTMTYSGGVWGAPVQITGCGACTASGTFGDPSWSKDGLHIVVGHLDSGNNLNIFIINPDGTGLLQVTHWGVVGALTFEGGDPCFNALGTQIAYEFDINGNHQGSVNALAFVHIVNVDGTFDHTTGASCPDIGCHPVWLWQ